MLTIWLYVRHCDDYPDPSVLKSFLRNELLKTINPDNTVQFSQWVRSQLVKEESNFDDFIENLAGKFGKSTGHYYVAKKHVENLQFWKCVIVLGFEEDAALGLHWNNS